MKNAIFLSLVIPAALLASPSPDLDRIIPANHMLVARASHTATLMPDGRVFIAGGFGGSGHETAPYTSTEMYDPATGRFSAGPSMPDGRSGHTATLLRDGRVLLAGGWTRDGAWGTADIYDSRTQRIVRAARMVVPRAGQSATLLQDGRVLIAGGEDRSETELSSAEIFDPRTSSFTRVGDMSTSRAAHTATLLSDGRVVIIGGSNGKYPNETIHSSAEIFDPRTNRFSPAGNIITPRSKHAAVLLSSGEVLIAGGSDHRAWQGQLNSAELYDPRTHTSRAVSNMAEKRFKVTAAMTQLTDGRVVIGGGARDAEVYDPATRAFTGVLGSLGAARFYAATTPLRTGAVLITGGYAEENGDLPSSADALLFVPGGHKRK